MRLKRRLQIDFKLSNFKADTCGCVADSELGRGALYAARDASTTVTLRKSCRWLIIAPGPVTHMIRVSHKIFICGRVRVEVYYFCKIYHIGSRS